MTVSHPFGRTNNGATGSGPTIPGWTIRGRTINGPTTLSTGEHQFLNLQLTYRHRCRPLAERVGGNKNPPAAANFTSLLCGGAQEQRTIEIG